jgi:electron transfer flavoprotein beta subunit
MRIAVCVKHVPSGRWRLDPDSARLDRSGPGELNRADKNAIEEALRVKERMTEVDVVAVSMGPKQAVESLRTALALGVDRAVLICDVAAVGSDLLGTARVLAAVLAGEECDLALFGQQSEDGVGGVLLAAIADLMRLPFASQAAELEVNEQLLRVTRQTESGDEVIDVPLPALVSVGDSINEPRYTSLTGVIAAKRKPLVVLTLGDIGIDGRYAGSLGAGTTVLSSGAPPTRETGTRVEDESTAAEAILAFLADREMA